MKNFLLALIVLVGFSCKAQNNQSNEQAHSTTEKQETPKNLENDEVAYFASGCFWCVEYIFESVEGVSEAVSGYAGGHTKNPTYQSTGTGNTGHAEAVKVYYNPKVVSFTDLVAVYFDSHNPTTANGQYPDFGSQYRAIAFYNNNKEKEVITAAIDKLNKEVYDGKIATEVAKIENFYKAEDYHQDFKKKHPNHGYIRAVSVPRFNKFKSVTKVPLKKH